MQIGDKAPDKPSFGESRMFGTCTYSSEVIYIHPERRYYRARYTFFPVGMSFVECHFLGRRRAER